MTDIPVTHRRSFIPWLFVIGMLIVIGANSALIYFAAATWSGVAVQHPYESGVAYNRVLAAEARQDALGWRLDGQLRQGAAGTELVISAVDASGAAVRGLAIDVDLERPVGPAETQHIALHATAPGVYAGDASLPGAGQWEARISATRGADRLYVSQRLFVP
jgi:nitrogen fixation protein FixH